MSFAWLDYLTLAEALRTKPDEASHRTAVSRAYYAAFHRAQSFLKKRDPNFVLPREGDSHIAVWNAVQRFDDKASADGARIRIDRNWADYQTGAPRNARTEADRVVLVARSLVRRLEDKPEPQPATD